MVFGFLVCDGVLPHLRVDRHIVESGERHDHRNADGHLRDVSGDRLDGGAYAALAITIGGVVAIAAANAGATSQDLKTGYLVGATPVRQQIGLIVGVLVASFFIGLTLIGMNKGLEKYTPNVIPINLAQLPEGVQVETQNYEHAGKTYVLVNALGSQEVPDGKYLYDPATEANRNPVGAGNRQRRRSRPAGAPDGHGHQRHPDAAAAVETRDARRLPGRRDRTAGRALAFFRGGLVSFDRDHGGDFRRRRGALARRAQQAEDRRSRKAKSVHGALYSSGLIAAGGVVGLLAIIIKLMEIRGWVTPDKFNVGDKMDRRPRDKRLAGRRDVPAACVVAVRLRAQEAGVAHASACGR